MRSSFATFTVSSPLVFRQPADTTLQILCRWSCFTPSVAIPRLPVSGDEQEPRLRGHGATALSTTSKTVGRHVEVHAPPRWPSVLGDPNLQSHSELAHTKVSLTPRRPLALHRFPMAGPSDSKHSVHHVRSSTTAGRAHRLARAPTTPGGQQLEGLRRAERMLPTLQVTIT